MIGLFAVLTVLCIGDSLTLNDSYCAQSEHVTSIVAENGTTTQWWVDPDVHTNLIIPALAAQPVDVVTILLTTNDVAGKVDPLQAQANLRELVAMLESEGVQDIMLSVPPYFQDVENEPLYAVYIDVLDEMAIQIWRVAADPDNVARFGVDWRTLDLPFPEVWWDAVHPNADGHTLAAPVVDAAIARALPVPARGPVGIAVLVALFAVTASWTIRTSSILT